MLRKKLKEQALTLTQNIGTVESLIFHTIFFAVSMSLAFFKIVPLNDVLLVLTTVVSREAIYLSIFIQMTVNENVTDIKSVTSDIDKIQEDVDKIQENVDDIQENVEILNSDDVNDSGNDFIQKQEHINIILERLDMLTKELHKIRDEISDEERTIVKKT